jgi:hypothetical protein
MRLPLISIAAIACLQGCIHVDKQWFYVPSATFAEDGRHREMASTLESGDYSRLSLEDSEFVVFGHRIAAGNGMVFAYREYNASYFLIPDQASFEKVTAYLPSSSVVKGQKILISPTTDAVAYKSSSSSTFPGYPACLGYASSGSIEIVDLSAAAITATLDLYFPMRRAPGSIHECRNEAVRGTHVFRRLEAKELTPWQGRKGKHIYDETVAP